MLDKNAKNCWDFWKCPKELKKRCAASMANLGRDCWIVTKDVLLAESPKKKQGFKFCWDCPWFKNLNAALQG